MEATASLGFILGSAGLRPVGSRCFARARRMATRFGDVRQEAQSLYLEAMYWIGFGRWDAVRTLATRAAALFESIGDAHEAEIAHTIAAHGWYYAGRLDGADDQIASVQATAAARSNAQHLGWAQFMRARSLILRGRPEEAAALCATAHDLIAHLPDTPSNVMLDGTFARAAFLAGDTATAWTCCRRLGVRMARGEWPATGQCIDGMSAAADVLLGLRETGAAPAGGEALDREIGQALRALQRFARLFPIARPALHRSRARRLHADGRRARAARAWQRSLAAAARLGMPIDAALVHLDAARLGDGPPDVAALGTAVTALLPADGVAAFVARTLGAPPRSAPEASA
jgi:hypothetical protein